MVYHLRQAGALFILLTATATLISCDSPSPAPGVPQLSFTRYQPIYLDVANIDVVEEYKSPMQEPNVEHLIPISPAEAVHVWVKDRLRSAGLNKAMQVIIKDASVVTSAPPPPKDPSVKPDLVNKLYTARLEVEMRIYGTDDAMSEASIDVWATQANTLPRSATIEERKAMFRRLITSLMESENAELEKQIFKYFNKSIIYAQTP